MTRRRTVLPRYDDRPSLDERLPRQPAKEPLETRLRTMLLDRLGDPELAARAAAAAYEELAQRGIDARAAAGADHLFAAARRHAARLAPAQAGSSAAREHRPPAAPRRRPRRSIGFRSLAIGAAVILLLLTATAVAMLLRPIESARLLERMTGDPAAPDLGRIVRDELALRSRPAPAEPAAGPPAAELPATAPEAGSSTDELVQWPEPRADEPAVPARVPEPAVPARVPEPAVPARVPDTAAAAVEPVVPPATTPEPATAPVDAPDTAAAAVEPPVPPATTPERATAPVGAPVPVARPQVATEASVRSRTPAPAGTIAARVVVHVPADSPGAAADARRILEELRLSGVAELELHDVDAVVRSGSVRYFFAADAPAGTAVLQAIDRALGGTGWRLRDLTTYEPKPRRTTVEVWIPARS